MGRAYPFCAFLAISCARHVPPEEAALHVDMFILMKTRLMTFTHHRVRHSLRMMI